MSDTIMDPIGAWAQTADRHRHRLWSGWCNARV